jgi:hypothetical protein
MTSAQCPPRPTPFSYHCVVAAQLDRLLDLFGDIRTQTDLDAARATAAHMRDIADAIEKAANASAPVLWSDVPGLGGDAA